MRGRHAAFARAHDHGQAFDLVQVGDAHGEAFPHVGRKRADGHAADADGIDLADRRDEGVAGDRELAAFNRERQLLRGKVPAQERPDAELMPARVERRVGQHRDARELEFIERRDRRIVPPAAPHEGNAALVLEVVELVLKIVFREDGVRGADERAGAAADAVAFDLRDLPDHVGQPARDLGLRAWRLRRTRPAGCRPRARWTSWGRRPCSGRSGCSGPRATG